MQNRMERIWKKNAYIKQEGILPFDFYSTLFNGYIDC